MTTDRLLLGAVLAIGAVCGLDSVSPARAVAFLAGAVGIVAVHQRLRNEYPAAVATLTAVLIFGATSLLWSMTQAASPVDAACFAIVAVIVLAIQYAQTAAARAAGWALTAAVPVLMRLAFGPVADVASAPMPISAIDALFSPVAGFFSLTPAVYAAAIGMAFYARRERAIAIMSIAVVSVWLATVQIVPSAGGEPFRHGLTAALALIAPGLAAIIQYATARPLVAAAPLLLAAMLWNYWLMVQYTAGMLPKDEPVSFAAMVRQQADVQTRAPYAYPFAFPVNLLFAWREGVPVDRYERLSSAPVAREFEIAMDHGADPFLLQGWGGVGPTPSGLVRWTAARRVTMVFRLQPSASDLRVEIDAASRVEEPAVSVDLGVAINDHEVGRVTATPTPGRMQLVVPAQNVGRLLRAGYNRLTIVNLGIRRIDPADARPLGPLAARHGEIPFPVAVYRIRVTPVS